MADSAIEDELAVFYDIQIRSSRVRRCRVRAIAFGFFTHGLQAEKLIQAASASFSMRKSAF